MAEGGRLVETESSIGVDDADIEDITDFRTVEESPASSVSECSGDRRAGPGEQPYRDDVTGAVLDFGTGRGSSRRGDS
eukprot:6035190-Alexandrium_andersonii.AAC.1